MTEGLDLLRLYEPDECGPDGYPISWRVGFDGAPRIPDVVRELAGHRCVRCGHPYRTGQSEPQWSPCDEHCTHQGPGRVRPGWNEHGEGMGDCAGDVDPWSPSTATPDDATAGMLVEGGIDVEAEYRVLTVHHLTNVKADCRWWNLAALCQRCHLTIQGRVQMEQLYPFEHSAWFKPYAAYDGSRQHTLDIGGHKVVVQVEREDRANREDRWTLEKIIFWAKKAKARDAVVAMLEGLLTTKQAQRKSPTLFMPSRWGVGWQRRGDLPPRKLDSVILKEGQLERLLDDLKTFLAAEDSYAETSQPWHRGYLFHGSPGTGKTSLARALADHFGLPTYYLPLGDIGKDADLLGCVGAIEPRSVLLLEDVDVYHAATVRDEEKEMVSLSAMLNVLDGIWTPHGLITIMTTNDRERLDDALVRAGRIDVDEEFTPLDKRQARRLAERFERPDIRWVDYAGRAPAEMIEALRG